MKKVVLHRKIKFIITSCCMTGIVLLIFYIYILKQEQKFLFLRTVDKIQEINNISISQVIDKTCKLKASLFSVTIEKNDNSVVGENQKIIAEIYYEQPVVAGNFDTVSRINEYFEMEAEGWIHGEVSRLTLYGDRWWKLFHHQLDDMREMYGDDRLAVQPCIYTVKTELMYQNENYICFRHLVKYQTGGPSCTYCFGTTFDKSTGEIVPINEIVEIDGKTLKAMLVASYEEEGIDKKRKDCYERLIEMLYGSNAQNDFIITRWDNEIELNYEYYYDGEFFYIILNSEIDYYFWWEVGWNGKIGSEMKLIFPTS